MNWRRNKVILPLIFIALIFACSGNNNQDVLSEDDLLQKARGIHERVFALDTHLDIEVTFVTPDLDVDNKDVKLVTISGMEKGGLDGAVFAIYIAQGPRTEADFKSATNTALAKFEKIHDIIEGNFSDKIEIAYRTEDIKRIISTGKKVALIGVENGYAIGKNLKNIKKFYDLGARYITLSHNGHNQICDSNVNPGGPETEYNGVSAFGKRVIAEMNRLGILIDVSHLSKKSMLDAVSMSKTPVIASHSCCRAICDVSRNLDDEQLLALKNNGGLINIVAINSYVIKDPAGKRTELEDLRKKYGLPIDYWENYFSLKELPEERKAAYYEELKNFEKKYPSPTVKDFVDQIDYAVNKTGMDNVGISSDFYQGDYSIKGWENAAETFNVTLELVRRGYSEKDIEKLWGGNFIRVLKEAEALAGEN